MIKYISHSQDETRLFASDLIKKIPLGSVIALTGDLGAGKTTFVQGVASALGIEDKVASPTFNIMKLYLGDVSLIHIDAYRLENMDHNIGLDEYIGYEKGYTFIEWPMYIPELLPENYIEINISNLGDNNREIVVKGL
ncbi:MAG: tRNA (adenosine(37)-N6)-threonylcarbamoyltransferase complex ATPase subunit type 1 TsaE [Bacilli bacterium]|nr:tRNA (adenosine(37)-N6)-threonylcarbamoyltransferase complex ATPase subunit type 1 TsaE [Bacilli bacterium]MBO4682363.1 tRNA (adenosine(37)-N6)-threonylcarbamoyltransferase complex ATPase subunit type 1 TsaE [Bacilli bacterium]